MPSINPETINTIQRFQKVQRRSCQSQEVGTITGLLLNLK